LKWIFKIFETIFCVLLNFVREKLVRSIKIAFPAGLEKTQVLLKKPAGRLNAGFFTGFSGKTGFSLKMPILGGQYQ
jgi:hypothetical protein